MVKILILMYDKFDRGKVETKHIKKLLKESQWKKIVIKTIKKIFL